MTDKQFNIIKERMDELHPFVIEFYKLAMLLTQEELKQVLDTQHYCQDVSNTVNYGQNKPKRNKKNSSRKA